MKFRIYDDGTVLSQDSFEFVDQLEQEKGEYETHSVPDEVIDFLHDNANNSSQY